MPLLGCYPNSTGGLQCHCEDEYAWSCDQCIVHGDCSNSSSQTCSCINGLPPDKEFCQPITSKHSCLVNVISKCIFATKLLQTSHMSYNYNLVQYSFQILCSFLHFVVFQAKHKTDSVIFYSNKSTQSSP